MSGDSKGTSGHVPLLHLDDKNVHLLGSDTMIGDWTGFQEKESLAHLSEEEMEGDEEKV